MNCLIPDVANVLIPVSGGGLAGGIAVAMKARKPKVRIIGVSMAQGAAMYLSLQAGKPVEVEEAATIADSLCGGIGLDNTYTFDLAREFIDDFVLVDESGIAAAIRHAHRAEGETVEGGGAVGIAAILAGGLALTGPTAIVVSGGNIDPALHARLVGGGTRGRTE